MALVKERENLAISMLSSSLSSGQQSKVRPSYLVDHKQKSYLDHLSIALGSVVLRLLKRISQCPTHMAKRTLQCSELEMVE